MSEHHFENDPTPALEQSTAPRPERARLPIVFHPSYDIDLPKLYASQPFDFEKRGKVHREVLKNFDLELQHISEPDPLDEELLTRVHSVDYLRSLSDSATMARIMGLPQLEGYSFDQLDQSLLESLRRATAGSLLSADLALEHGWSINLSGGFHHAKPDAGGGFCFFNDIALMVHHLHEQQPDCRVLIIDLDAHLGDGTIYSLFRTENAILFDVFNQDIFPRDMDAAALAEFAYPVRSEIRDEEYLALIREAIPFAIERARPDFIIFNAGADVHENDKLGRMGISMQGVVERDAIVLSAARDNGIPFSMLLAGAYSERAWRVISRSIQDNFGHDIARFLDSRSEENDAP